MQLRARIPKKHEVRLCDVQHAQLSGAHLLARRDFQNNNLGEHGREALAGNEDEINKRGKKKNRKITATHTTNPRDERPEGGGGRE